MPRSPTRWTLYGAALVLALVGVRMVEPPGDRVAVARARVDAERRTVAPMRDAAEAPTLHLQLLAQRSQRDIETDLFNARSWEALAAEEASRNAPPPPPPPPPRAPPLPFTFMGKLIDAGEVTVFLTNGERNWVVRSGDTIDGTYRVEGIGDQKMTLTHLALRLPQELAIGEGTVSVQPVSILATTEPLPAPVPSGASDPSPGEVRLLLAAPARVVAGNELIVSLALPSGGGARAARVELAYDPQVLAAIGASPRDAGRVTIELAGAAAPLAQVRFRVIAQSPTTTRIGIEQATATDARGTRLSIGAPAAHSVQVVPAGG